MKKNFILFLAFYLITLSVFAQIPVGYYTAAEGKADATLKSQLSAIISAGAIDKGYDGLYDIYKTSDNLPSGKVWDMYSLKSDGTANYYFTHTTDKCGSYSSEGNCYNREHTFCDSWLGAASPQRSDAHHILPTDGYVNNRRSSYPHGKVGTATWTSSNGSKLGNADASTGYSGIVFEPIDEFKGDFARMYFYVATRYESKIAGWAGNGSAGEILAGNSYPAYKAWFYTMLLQWNAQDPVSQKEITRNNAIAAIQKNRNPYIDYPELAEFIWGAKKGQAWSASGGIYPTLFTPSAGSTIDFGKIAYLQTAGSSLQISAAKLTGSLTFTISGTDAANFSISTTTITKAQAEAGYILTINYSAQTVGAQTAQINISGGGITTTIVNLRASSSDEFLALPATNVSSTGFNANWTSSAAATGYSLNVFTMQSSGTTTAQTLLEEDFTSGLPTTWTSSGYASGTDLTGSIKLSSGSKNGVIATPTINMSTPTTLKVTAKQYGTDAGAKLTVKVNTDSITTFVTAVASQDFTVSIPAKTSSSTVTLSALSGSGNRLYVDYVKLETQGSAQTPVSIAGYPLVLLADVLTATVGSLTPSTNYYYTVTPQGNSATVSNQIQLTTDLTDALKSTENFHVTWVVLSNGIQVRNLPSDCRLTLMNVMGKKIQTLMPTDFEAILKPEIRGVYLLQIQKGQEFSSYKILY